MAEDVFNMKLRRFLKKAGVTSRREADRKYFAAPKHSVSEMSANSTQVGFPGA